jgi:hypothetical protein
MEELTPEASWLGRVVCRRHVLPSRRTMYLLLRRQTCGWNLQAALIEQVPFGGSSDVLAAHGWCDVRLPLRPTTRTGLVRRPVR